MRNMYSITQLTFRVRQDKYVKKSTGAIAGTPLTRSLKLFIKGSVSYFTTSAFAMSLISQARASQTPSTYTMRPTASISLSVSMPYKQGSDTYHGYTQYRESSLKCSIKPQTCQLASVSDISAMIRVLRHTRALTSRVRAEPTNHHHKGRKFAFSDKAADEQCPVSQHSLPSGLFF